MNLLKTAFVWISRATGLGYQPYPPLVGSEVSVDHAIKFKHKTDKLVLDVQRLDRELRRRGQLDRSR